MIAICIEWTGIFELSFGLLSVYLLHNKTKYLFLGGIFYGISLYLNPVMLMLIPSMLIVLNYTNGKSGI